MAKISCIIWTLLCGYWWGYSYLNTASLEQIASSDAYALGAFIGSMIIGLVYIMGLAVMALTKVIMR